MTEKESMKYYIRNSENGKTHPVEGERIEFSGFEGINLFIHPPVKELLSFPDLHPHKYYISEARTGFWIGRGANKKEAIKMAWRKLQKNGREKAEEIINAAINKAGCLLDGSEHKELP